MTDDKDDAIRLPDESSAKTGGAKPSPGEATKPTTADLVRQAADNGGDSHGKVAETTVRGPAPGGPGSGATGNGDGAAARIVHPEGPRTEGRADDEKTAPLFSIDESGKLSGRWDAIQVGFVDEPRKAVEDADSLVASTMQRLAEMFADERSRLEGQWDRGDDVSTEDLRVALRRYRAFFGRLLAI
jgi:hypothetical protein